MNIQSSALFVSERNTHKCEMDAALTWLALVLTNFAKAEQAIGKFSVALGLPIENGSLGQLNEVRCRLSNANDKKCKLLEKRIARWLENRPFRHLLAHATIQVLYDADANPVVLARHLPRDSSDVTPDRLWTEGERENLLRQATSGGRSICDHIDNILGDSKLLQLLNKPTS